MNTFENHESPLKKSPSTRNALLEKFISTRRLSGKICEPLEKEDYVVQPCSEVSPPKWHLGHTTWFFEEMILSRFYDGYSYFDENLKVLFNSYYKSIGKHWVQGDRGYLSRPTVREVFDYRYCIDEKMISFLNSLESNAEIDFLLEAGINHEQQHQELLLMDIKYILAMNPSFPVYNKKVLPKGESAVDGWKSFDEGVYETGHDDLSFAFDNEKPKHKTYLYPYAIRKNSVSNGEYLDFVAGEGYTSPKYWLSEGWDWASSNSVECPLYWVRRGKDWFEYTLHGLVPLDLNAPVTHISYFEADAFARWSGQRLPTEFELETYLKGCESPSSEGYSLSHPISTNNLRGQTWFWTRSHYSPYPGFQAFKGALGEYNGKFMCNQFVLRGGCMATPEGHYRHSYRNFFQPQQRWMFSSICLAKDI